MAFSPNDTIPKGPRCPECLMFHSTDIACYETPEGATMTNETVHIQPAIPSRAAQQPAFPNQPSPGTVERHPSGARIRRNAAGEVQPPKRKKKKANALSAGQRLRVAEIKQINAKRKKNLKKAAAPVPKKRRAPYGTMARAAKKAAKRNVAIGPHKSRGPVVAKNPNRPLEMKHQLSAVLSMVGTLQKAELMFFSQAVPAMQALSRSGRKRVIAALQQVYG